MEPYRRDNGLWYARINGRRRSLGLPKGASKTQARRRAEQMLLDSKTPATAASPEKAPVMLSGLWGLFLDLTRPQASAHTITKYRQRWHRIKKIWGDRDAREITALDCASLQATLAQHFKPNTVNATMVTLGSVLKLGVRDFGLVTNPTSDIKRLKIREEAWDWYTRKEAALFLEKCAKHAPHYHPLVVLALNTGARKTELTRLPWSSVDLQRRTIRVHGKGDKFRTIPLNDAALEALREQRLRTALKGEHVFETVRGAKEHNSNTLCRLMRRIAKLAGLRAIRWHDLRHSFASQLVSEGVAINTVARLMGHADVRITYQTYAHLAPEAMMDAVTVLDGPLKQSTKTTQQKENRKTTP